MFSASRINENPRACYTNISSKRVGRERVGPLKDKDRAPASDVPSDTKQGIYVCKSKERNASLHPLQLEDALDNLLKEKLTITTHIC